MRCRVRGVEPGATHHIQSIVDPSRCAKCNAECHWTTQGFVEKPTALDEAGRAIPMPSEAPASSSPVGFAWRKVECWQATIGKDAEGKASRWLSFSVELLDDGDPTVIGLRARYRVAITECREGVWFRTIEALCATWSEVQRKCGDFAAEWLKAYPAAAVEVDSGKAIGVEAGTHLGDQR